VDPDPERCYFVKGMPLGQAVPLLQNAGNVVRLKLTRVVTIPERDFAAQHGMAATAAAKGFRLPPPRAGPSGKTIKKHSKNIYFSEKFSAMVYKGYFTYFNELYENIYEQ
jgi:hypothetical protein